MPVQLMCKNCGDAFSVKPKDRGRLFCKRACQTAYEGKHGRLAAHVPLLEFTCKQCGQPFSMKPSIVTALRKKWGRDPLYCSMPCSDLGRRADTAVRNVFTCIQCGKTNQMKRYAAVGRTRYNREQKFCDNACKSAYQSAQSLARFNAGQLLERADKRGYVSVYMPTLLTGKKGNRLKHRMVMEQHIGRPLLPEETVHHKNGDRSFNDLSNLELFSSRHGPGQRVIDKLAFALEMCRLYPEFIIAAGGSEAEHGVFSKCSEPRPALP